MIARDRLSQQLEYYEIIPNGVKNILFWIYFVRFYSQVFRFLA